MFALVNTVHCQTDWQSYWSQTTLPQKAKLKTVTYKSIGYTAVGYVFKNQFVEGQEISFRSIETFQTVYSKTKTTTFPIINGIYFVKDGISYLESTVENNYYRIKGILKVSNTYDGKGLTAKTGEATKLSIETVDIIQCSGFYQNGKYPVSLQKDLHSSNYALKIEFDDRVLESIIPSDYYFLNMFKGTPSYMNFDTYINKSKDVKLTYKNGNVFVGIVEKNNDYYRAKQGEYNFATGEKYTGTFKDGNLIYLKGRIFVPDQGETIFADGTIANGDWLKEYNFTNDEWKQIYENAKSLTKIRDMAVQIVEEKERKIQEEKIAKERAEQEKRLKKQQRKQEYISKYGEEWANLILQGKYTVGMTIEMVQEMEWGDVFGNDNRIKMESGYTKSISTYGNNKVETWRLNSQIAREWRGMEIFGMNAYDINAPNFPTLVFTNGKLTDIYRY